MDPRDRAWQRRGACPGQAVYFDEEADDPFERVFRERRAKALCGRCAVRARCAAYALDQREPHGIWGGFNESQRRRLLALGWEDTLDRWRRTVDVARLEARLHGSADTVTTARMSTVDHQRRP